MADIRFDGGTGGSTPISSEFLKVSSSPINATPKVVSDNSGAPSNLLLANDQSEFRSSTEQCALLLRTSIAGSGLALVDSTTTNATSVGVGALGDNLCFRSGGVAQGTARLFSTGNLVIGSSLTDNGFQVETEDRDASFLGVRVGRGAGSDITNTLVGNNSMGNLTTANNNTAVGSTCLTNATTGGNNTAIGSTVLNLLTGGSFNVSVGNNSQNGNLIGVSNVSVGQNTLNGNNLGNSNVAIGRSALALNTASNNTAIGFEAGTSNTSGVGLTAIGYNALRLSTANDNTAIGFQALQNSTGQNNTAIGSGAGGNSTAGNSNVILGHNSAPNINSSLNVVIGQATSFASTASTNNVLIGAVSVNNGTGASNVTIGAGATNATFSNCVILGRSATAGASNEFVVGSSTAGQNVGVVTTEAAVQVNTWLVRINGSKYKILLTALIP
jgi:hypothetical protein